MSQYKYRIKTKQLKKGNQDISFGEWVSKTYSANKDLKYYNKPQMFLPQVEWLKNYQGNIEIDKIIRFENLNEGVNEVFEKLNINQKLPHLNKTSKTNYKDFYDKESKKIIEDWFQEDIVKFDYTF